MIHGKGNEQKALNVASDAYWHLKEYLSDNYETLSEDALNNVIHNVEQLIPMTESPELQLLTGYDQANYKSRMDCLVDNGIYPKL